MTKNGKLSKICRKFITTLLIAIFAIHCVAQEPHKIQAGVLKTRWAKDVSPTNALKEYPRPQLVRLNWQNLNGLWDYAVTKKNEKVKNFMGKILVPFPIESILSGVKKRLMPDENLWYRRTFQVKTQTKNVSNNRTLLHFGAVDWQATVYLNGIEIGSHNGGYTEFTFDITNHLRKGSNVLTVRVFDPTDEGIGPHGKQLLNPQNIYYTPTSGIWQTVWIEEVPAIHIEKLVMTPDVDRGMLNLIIKGGAGIGNVKVLDGDKVIATSYLSLKGGYNQSVEKKVLVKIPNAKLWTPDSPHLYNLEITLGNDKVRSYFGMRKISVAKDNSGIDRIMLNNKPYYNLGTLDQGFWPDGLYTAPTDEALAFDIKTIKAMGFNTIRKHIKIEPARWYYHADRIGMLVWQDLVNPNQKLPEGSKAEFEKESAEAITQLHNYPSIVCWVLFNEKWGQYDQGRLTNWVKKSDPTRIINGHSGEFLYVNNKLRSPSINPYINSDLTDVHSYPYPRIANKIPDMAQVCGEFGGIGVPIAGHIWDDLQIGWGYDGLVGPAKLRIQFQSMVDTLKKLQLEGLSGSIYT